MEILKNFLNRPISVSKLDNPKAIKEVRDRLDNPSPGCSRGHLPTSDTSGAISLNPEDINKNTAVAQLWKIKGRYTLLTKDNDGNEQEKPIKF